MKRIDPLPAFPCTYPLKVVGENTNEFYAVVSAAVEKHLAEGETSFYSTRTSSGGKYLSITAIFKARSQEQLTAIYKDLSQHKFVLMMM
jgi:putative lipoic acid-binding regulatory protein